MEAPEKQENGQFPATQVQPVAGFLSLDQYHRKGRYIGQQVSHYNHSEHHVEI